MKPTKEQLKKYKRYHDFKENKFLKRVYDQIKNENPLP